MNIWRCHLNSRNFSFEAYGATALEARETFAKGLRRHADKTGADQAWADEAVTEAEPRRIALGTFYRDGEKLK